MCCSLCSPRCEVDGQEGLNLRAWSLDRCARRKIFISWGQPSSRPGPLICCVVEPPSHLDGDPLSLSGGAPTATGRALHSASAPTWKHLLAFPHLLSHTRLLRPPTDLCHFPLPCGHPVGSLGGRLACLTPSFEHSPKSFLFHSAAVLVTGVARYSFLHYFDAFASLLLKAAI